MLLFDVLMNRFLEEDIYDNDNAEAASQDLTYERPSLCKTDRPQPNTTDNLSPIVEIDIENEPDGEISHPRTINCTICRRPFATKKDLRLHINSAHTDVELPNSRQCDYCEKFYTSTIALKHHVKENHSEIVPLDSTSNYSTSVQIKCDDCGKSFRSKSVFQRHKLNAHSGIKSDWNSLTTVVAPGSVSDLLCKPCKQNFKTINDLNRHNDIIHRFTSRDDVFGNCSVCSTPFGSENSLRKHMGNVHFDVPFIGSIQCNICQRYLYRAHLSGHVKKYHNDILPNIEKYYGTKSPVENNQIVPLHTTDNVTFNTRSDVAEYMKQIRDDGETEFGCPMCQITMQSSALNIGNIVKHLRLSHNLTFDAELVQEQDGEEIQQTADETNGFSCKFCKLNFKTYPLLNSHNVRTHRTDSPHDVVGKCEVCEAPFASLTTMRRHMVVIHSDVPFSGSALCQLCDQYIYQSNVAVHNRTYHQGNNINVTSIFTQSDYQTPSNRRSLRSSTHQPELDQEENDIENDSVNMLVSGNVDSAPDSNMDVDDDEWCLYCNRGYSDQRGLDRHMNEVHCDNDPGRITATCNVCAAPFACPKTLTSHMKLMHQSAVSENLLITFPIPAVRKKLYTFMKRPDFSNTKPILRTKDDLVTEPITGNTCNLCYYQFSQTYKAKNHLQEIHGNQNPAIAKQSCELCSALFVSQKTLVTHYRRIHQRLVEFQCKVCDKLASTKFNIKNHTINDHDLLENDVLDNINVVPGPDEKHNHVKLGGEERVFRSRSDAVAYINKYRDDGVSVFNCPICDVELSTNATNISNFIKHLARKHKLTLPDDVAVLQDSAVIDSGTAVYKCNVCHYKSDHQLDNIHKHLKEDHDIPTEDLEFNCRLISRKNDKTIEPGSECRINQSNESQISKSSLEDTKSKDYKLIPVDQTKPSDSLSAGLGLVEVKSVRCSPCKRNFIRSQDCKRHVEQVHGNNNPEIAKFMCLVCPVRFVTQRNVSTHMLETHKVHTGYECLVCHTRTNHQPFRIREHLKHAHNINEKEYHEHCCLVKENPVDDLDTTSRIFEKSNEASKLVTSEKTETIIFTKKCEVVAYMKKHHDEDRVKFTCPFCDQLIWSGSRNVFNFSRHLISKHDVVFEDVEPVIQNDPKCSASKRPKLELVRLIKKAEEPMDCCLCQQTFRNLTGHMKSIHGNMNNSTAPFDCNICPAIFVKDHYLVSHLREVHSFETEYECLECQQVFQKPTSIRHHICRIHKIAKSTVKNHYKVNRKEICAKPVCLKPVSVKQEYIEEVICNSVTPVQRDSLQETVCSICDVYVSGRRALVQHMRSTHPLFDLETNQFKCKLCSDFQNSETKLIEHLEHIHGDAPFPGSIPCVLCNRQFWWLSFAQHVAMHREEGDEPNVCYVCGATFSSVYFANRHLKEQHQIVIAQATPKVAQCVDAGHCPVCDKAMLKQSINRHLRQVHQWTTDQVEIGQFTCDICDIDQPSKHKLDRHHKIMHRTATDGILESTAIELRQPISDQHIDERNLLPCDRPRRGLDGRYWCHMPSCQQSFPTAKGQSSHFISSHWKFRFYCTECSTSMSSADSFRRHDCQKLHRNLLAKPYRKVQVDVDLTDKDIKTRSHRRLFSPHVSPIKLPIKAIECIRCVARFDTDDKYNRHLRFVHFEFAPPGPSRQQLQCEICYIDVTTVPALVSHIVECHVDHEGNGKMQCPQCRKPDIPEQRIALHLKYCKKIDSESGKICIETSSSGFGDDMPEGETTCERSNMESMNVVRKYIVHKKPIYIETSESDNAQSSDELPEMDDLPQLEIQSL